MAELRQRQLPQAARGAIVLLLTNAAILAPGRGAAQLCAWGGASSVPAPAARFLRSHRSLFHAPSRVAVGGDGRVYVADPRAGKVVVYDRYRRLVAVRLGLGQPTAIAVDAAGDIYVADQQRRAIDVYDRSWRRLRGLGSGAGEIALATDMAADPDPARDRIYVADGGANVIRIYQASGARVASLGGKGSSAGLFDFPAAIYASARGELFVADQNNDRIQVFDAASGLFLRCIGSSGGMSFSRRFGRVAGLAGDGLGRLFVSDGFQGYVRVFDGNGAPLGTLGDFGNGPGLFTTPTGIAVDPDNRLYVASTNTASVEVWGIDDYRDPSVLAAQAHLHPPQVRLGRVEGTVTATVLVPGHAPDEVDLGTLTVNGTAGRAHLDRGTGAVRVQVRLAALAPTLVAGEAPVLVAGALVDGTPFEADATIAVLDGGGRR